MKRSTDHPASMGHSETLSPALPDAVEAKAARILERACALNLQLATAESCTGGLLASLLTDVEGASHAFERGFIVYSPEAKCDLLGVARAMIDDCGAVSRTVAIAMAHGALAHARADIAIAVTGYAGAAPDGNEPGLVHFACAGRDGTLLHREAHFGDIGRGPVRIGCIDISLDMIGQALDHRA